MRQSQLLIPTLKENPSEAEVVSHQLMLRAGYIRKLASGVYTYLPLCLRVLRKIENIVREELTKSGAQELLLPIVMPKEIWEETGRWSFYGKELLRFKDRNDHEFCIGPTHEEAITDLARREIKSYRDLPKNLFQIQTKFRDEIRPRFGLMRGREFIMKDSYSFDVDEEASKKTYKEMYECYKRIFTRCGLNFRSVEAIGGTIGGSMTHEFQVLADSGEDEIMSCNKCEYAANVEKAEIGRPEAPKDKAAKLEKQEISTPNKKSVEEVCEFLKTTPQNLVKTLIFSTDKGPVAGLVRGDHNIKESKLKDVLGVEWCHMAEEGIIFEVTNAPSGFAGPIGLKIPSIADYEVESMSNFVVGANKADTHIINCNLEDINVTKFADIRHAIDGDKCTRCGGTLKSFRGIEVGQVFYLGTKYSEKMKAVYLDVNSKEKTMVMGCYGIGIGRTAAAAIEQNHDDRGIIWPLPIAPFQVHLIAISFNDADVMKKCEEIYQELVKNGVEVLYDDRDGRPGVKFADADLIGIPYQVLIGSKGLKNKKAEIKIRKTGEKEEIKISKVVRWISKKLQAD